MQPHNFTTNKSWIRLNRAGALVSCICLVHCLGAPILMIAIPALLSPFVDHLLQFFFVLLSVTVTQLSIRTLGLSSPKALLLLLGTLLISAELVLDFTALQMSWLGYFGAILLLTSHLKILSTCNQCNPKTPKKFL